MTNINSVIKDHQTRIQYKRHQRMANDSNGHGDNSRNPLDIPAPGRRSPQVNHDAGNDGQKQVHPLEVLEDLRDLLEEVRILLLLGGRAPLHVNVQEMGEDGAVQVERQPAEEDGEHGHPFEVLA
jgi:hypothetical protein